MPIHSAFNFTVVPGAAIATSVNLSISAEDAAIAAEILRRGMHTNFGQPDHIYGQIDAAIYHLETLASHVSGHADAIHQPPLKTGD